MSLLSSKKSKAPVCSPACGIVKWVSALALMLAVIASVAEIYYAHAVGDKFQFGSAPGSLAILAFVVSLSVWTRQMGVCMKKDCEVCA